MSYSVSEFSSKYALKHFKVFENDNWIVSLRPEQKTPFSMIISVKADIFQMRDLDRFQVLELQECYNFIENVCYDELKVTKLNYLCLMMIDSIVHFHVFPRFEKPFEHGPYKLPDKYFPMPVDLTDGCLLNIKVIKKVFQEFLGISPK
ncbi:hypothetical protein OAG97_02140 [Akkermansiaceae bacterium]|nr:hypothetical protein [Akkermansiaceae bacterium]